MTYLTRIALAFATFTIVPAVAAAEPRALSPQQVIDFCSLPTLQSAIEQGEKLGWQRLTDAELEEWSNSFTSHLGSRPAAAVWNRTGADRTDSIAYWVAGGPNAHRACAYSTGDKAGLREALVAHFGEQADADPNLPDVAYWKVGQMQLAYSAMGDGAYVSFGYYDQARTP